jgi:hypothetical protein
VLQLSLLLRKSGPSLGQPDTAELSLTKSKILCAITFALLTRNSVPVTGTSFRLLLLRKSKPPPSVCFAHFCFAKVAKVPISCFCTLLRSKSDGYPCSPFGNFYPERSHFCEAKVTVPQSNKLVVRQSRQLGFLTPTRAQHFRRQTN